MPLLEVVKTAQQRADATGVRFEVWENTQSGRIFHRPAELAPPVPATVHRLVTTCEPGR